MYGILIPILVLIAFFIFFKIIRNEQKEEKTMGTIYVYQDELGEFQLYLEANVSPFELSKEKTVSFKVDLLARK